MNSNQNTAAYLHPQQQQNYSRSFRNFDETSYNKAFYPLSTDSQKNKTFQLVYKNNFNVVNSSPSKSYDQQILYSRDNRQNEHTNQQNHVPIQRQINSSSTPLTDLAILNPSTLQLLQSKLNSNSSPKAIQGDSKTIFYGEKNLNDEQNINNYDIKDPKLSIDLQQTTGNLKPKYYLPTSKDVLPTKAQNRRQIDGDSSEQLNANQLTSNSQNLILQSKGRINYSRSMTDNFQIGQTKLRAPSGNVKDSAGNSFSGQTVSSSNHQGHHGSSSFTQQKNSNLSQQTQHQQFYQIQNVLPHPLENIMPHSNIISTPQSPHVTSFQPKKHPGDQNFSDINHQINSNLNDNPLQQQQEQRELLISSKENKFSNNDKGNFSISSPKQSDFINPSYINGQNPYSFNKDSDKTPSKMRGGAHSQGNARVMGLSIEASTLNYGYVNSPYIPEASLNGQVRTNISLTPQSSGQQRSPYNLGFYSGKNSQIKTKNMNLSRPQMPEVSNSQLYSYSEEEINFEVNENQNQNQNKQNEKQFFNAPSSSSIQNQKQKNQKLTAASFSQLKSPVGSKNFLSPQSKFGFSGINTGSNSATNRKVASGESMNIFQNQSSNLQFLQSTSFTQQTLSPTQTSALIDIDQFANTKGKTTQQKIGFQIQEPKIQSGTPKDGSSDSRQTSQTRTSTSRKNSNTNKAPFSIRNSLESKDQFEQKNSSVPENIQKDESLSSGISSYLGINKVNEESIEKQKQQQSFLPQQNNFTDINTIINKSNKKDDTLNWQITDITKLSFSISELIKQTIIPNHESTKFSIKRNGIVKSYAANTNQGLIRNYNEDRVSIILNIVKPQGKNTETDVEWPKCSFFGVYDGHGGVACADFLRDNLHQYVIKDNYFPKDPKQAILNGFACAESHFLAQAQGKEGIIEKSGSCAIVVMIVGTKCFVANVGDSRAIMSGNGGQKACDLSRDHKPLDEIEQRRITEAGGKIYQTKIMSFQNSFGVTGAGINNQSQPIYGPHRVLPGRLSVTRTFGDIEAKLEKLGGNPNVVIATPDIKEFEITEELDFIILASDGIYDKIETKEAIESIWKESQIKQGSYKSVHDFSGIAVDTILKFALGRKSMDNVTVVMIGFDNLKHRLFSNLSSQLPVPNKQGISFEQKKKSINSLDSKIFPISVQVDSFQGDQFSQKNYGYLKKQAVDHSIQYQNPIQRVESTHQQKTTQIPSQSLSHLQTPQIKDPIFGMPFQTNKTDRNKTKQNSLQVAQSWSFHGNDQSIKNNSNSSIEKQSSSASRNKTGSTSLSNFQGIGSSSRQYIKPYQINNQVGTNSIQQIKQISNSSPTSMQSGLNFQQSFQRK